MKKSTKIVLLSLLGAAGAGLLIFYSVAPETFMNMLNTVMYYLNQPLPLVGISLLTLAVIVIKVFSSTSLGKSMINKFQEKTVEIENKFNSKVKEYEELANKYKEEAEQLKNETLLLKEDYENKLNVACSQFDFFETSVIKILEKLPNQKVQDELKKFNSDYEQKKQEIGLITGDGYQLLKDLVARVEAVENESKDNQTTEE